MQKLIIVLILLTKIITAQNLSVSGNLQDTVAKTGLQNAVVIALKLNDSTLVGFTRSDNEGKFSIKNLPIDTLQVIISHPKFGDQTFFVVGSKQQSEFDFGKIILPAKSLQLKEVIIVAYKESMYYKGDTLMYNADSFKVKQNATVEDLLKKLPGMKVDAAGKITAQGKAIDKVLVDGDEFFGTDPTMATKNLAANSVESVQVYEKKNDDANSDKASDEPLKVINLKLKDDAKKGYFGKVSAGSDFSKFYEGEVLANRFKKQQKISVFGVMANTPKTGLGWGDMFKYGLQEEGEMGEGDDDGDRFFTNSPPTQGIPQTIRGGIYYSDKLNTKTKINSNYSYNNGIVLTKTESRSQYFLTDTNYITNNTVDETKQAQTHKINITLNHNLDSLTKLTFSPKINYNLNESNNTTYNNYATTSDVIKRETVTKSILNAQGYDISNLFKIDRNFKKKDRNLIVKYNLNYTQSKTNGRLNTKNNFISDTVTVLNNIDQKKESSVNSQNHSVNLAFIEPLSKKFKIETSYDFTIFKNSQLKKSLNKIGDSYSALDSTYSNDFKINRMINRGGLKLIYEVKKLKIGVGSKLRQIAITNTNNFTQKIIKQNITNLLPFINVRYKYIQNSNVSFNYRTNSSLPSINQLQPLPNNSNQNNITIGNANLTQSFDHNFELNYNTWMPLSEKYVWAGGYLNIIQNAISESQVYDTLGRTVSQAVNVNGNYNSGAWLGCSWPMFSKKLVLNPNINYNTNNNVGFINNQKNSTVMSSVNGDFNVGVNLEKYEFGIGSNLGYNTSRSSLYSASNKPYLNQGYSAYFKFELPKHIFIASDATYTINSKRAQGYNLNYLIWNASIAKNFGKLENFIVGFKANDILNQNISANRDVTTNVITDLKTNIISRYFLLSITYKFNSQKTKENDEEM